MSHVFRFKAFGVDFADVENAARRMALDYFGCPDFTLECDAEAMHRRPPPTNAPTQ